MRNIPQDSQPKVGVPQKRKKDLVIPRMNIHFGNHLQRLIKLKGALRIMVGGPTFKNCTYWQKDHQDVLFRDMSGVENNVHSVLL